MKKPSPSPSSGKPAPSPGRVVKYHPPLMRFLRSSTGSKSSRVRPRAIPLFTRRKRSAIEAQQQEPSSPKVTCIGQVRVRRSSSKKNKIQLKRRSSSSKSGAGNWFCFWVGKPPTICCSFRFRRRKSSCWRKLVSLLCCRRSVEVPIDSPKKGPITTVTFSDPETEDQEEISSPPKNALMMTRCRSAPQRSSYLASQFWGSPIKTEGEQENTADEAAQLQAVESRIDLEGEGNLGISKQEVAETDFVTIKADAEGKKSEEKEEEKIVVLTRCKSEPARRRSSGDLDSTVSCRNSVESKCKKV